MWQHINEIINQQLRDNMENQYRILNKKLDALSNDKSKHNKQKTSQFQPKVINLSNTPLTKEQTNILSLGHSYAIEKEPKNYINELIIDTEVAIRQLEPKMQNTYRYLAAKQIKQILNSNRHNTRHKRQQYIVNQIKKILESNNLTIVKADYSSGNYEAHIIKTVICCHITSFYSNTPFYIHFNIKQLNEEIIRNS
jgi:hypothetical protein